jgi:hypothetical protein
MVSAARGKRSPDVREHSESEGERSPLIERDKLEMFKSSYDPRPGRKPIRRLLESARHSLGEVAGSGDGEETWMIPLFVLLLLQLLGVLPGIGAP